MQVYFYTYRTLNRICAIGKVQTLDWTGSEHRVRTMFSSIILLGSALCIVHEIAGIVRVCCYTDHEKANLCSCINL